MAKERWLDLSHYKRLAWDEEFPWGRDLFNRYAAYRELRECACHDYPEENGYMDLGEIYNNLGRLRDHVMVYRDTLGRPYMIAQPYISLEELKTELQENKALLNWCHTNSYAISVINFSTVGCGWHYYRTIPVEFSHVKGIDKRAYMFDKKGKVTSFYVTANPVCTFSNGTALYEISCDPKVEVPEEK